MADHKRLTGTDLHAGLIEATGNGSPVGVFTPSAARVLYRDDSSGALWSSTGATDQDWMIVPGGAGDVAAHVADKDNPHEVDHTDVASDQEWWNAAQIKSLDVTDDAPADGEVLAWSVADDKLMWTAAGAAALAAHVADPDAHGWDPDEAIYNASQLQGQDVAATAPSDGEALVWSDGSGAYVPSGILTLTLFTDHTDDDENPHAVTAAQVGSGTAQWNASQLQGIDITEDAPADGQAAVYSSAAGEVVWGNVLTQALLEEHAEDTNNPHDVTAAQVGNTTAQWNANQLQGRAISATPPTTGQALIYTGTEYAPAELASADAMGEHLARTDNPHDVTATQVGRLIAQWNAAFIWGNEISGATPVDGQVLTWDDGSELWTPKLPQTVPGLTLEVHDAVIQEGALVALVNDGGIVKAVPANAADPDLVAIGVADSTEVPGENITVRVVGIGYLPSGTMTPGARQFLAKGGDPLGGVTEDPSGYTTGDHIQEVGVAISASQILINIQRPIEL
jgi:hypothetical protein